MPLELPVRLVLVDPPAGVTFGIQQGRGAKYETLFSQQRAKGDIAFDFQLTVKDGPADGQPDFTGPIAQGPPGGRFVYVGVGTYAGQVDTCWSRRMKVPLGGIPWTLIRKVLKTPGLRLQGRVPGSGKDGTPSCATVKLIGGWDVARADAKD